MHWEVTGNILDFFLNNNINSDSVSNTQRLISVTAHDSSDSDRSVFYDTVDSWELEIPHCDTCFTISYLPTFFFLGEWTIILFFHWFFSFMTELWHLPIRWSGFTQLHRCAVKWGKETLLPRWGNVIFLSGISQAPHKDSSVLLPLPQTWLWLNEGHHVLSQQASILSEGRGGTPAAPQQNNRGTLLRGATPEAHPCRVICSGLAWQFETTWGPPCRCITHPLTPEALAAAITGENDHLWFIEGSANSLCWTQTLARGECGVRSRWNPPADPLCLLNSRECLGSDSHICPLVFFISREQILFTLRHLVERFS